ncbi:VOC family protein [Egicoccus sp. AB-alg2]|uniref:VOC family protein n=1 Tax=Egicoccus sp. AB-alg2 TaxID=3242693 RepID=UPI00359E2E45
MPRIVHFELPVDDPDRARAFYSSVFGWKLEGYGDQPYWLATTGEETEPGIDGALTGRSELASAPIVVIGVEDLDATVGDAVGHGAEQVQEKLPVPGMGWTAYLRDPEGNVVALWQSDEDAG